MDQQTIRNISLSKSFLIVTRTVKMVRKAALFMVCMGASKVLVSVCVMKKQTTAPAGAERYTLSRRHKTRALVPVGYHLFSVITGSFLVQTWPMQGENTIAFSQTLMQIISDPNSKCLHRVMRTAWKNPNDHSMCRVWFSYHLNIPVSSSPNPLLCVPIHPAVSLDHSSQHGCLLLG